MNYATRLELHKALEELFGHTAEWGEQGATFKSNGLRVFITKNETLAYRTGGMIQLVDDRKTVEDMLSLINANKIVAAQDFDRHLSYLESAKETCKTHIRVPVNYRVNVDDVVPILLVETYGIRLLRIRPFSAERAYVITGEDKDISLDRLFMPEIPFRDLCAYELEEIKGQRCVQDKDIQELGAVLKAECETNVRKLEIHHKVYGDVPDMHFYNEMFKPITRTFLEFFL